MTCSNARTANNTVTSPHLERTAQPAVTRYRIIDQHLLKARQSNTQAQRLQDQGLHADAEAQNRLTQVFIHNALSRVQTQRPDSA